MADDPLVLGPVLRYVDETSASVWVETSHPAEVRLLTAAGSWTAATFAVHGHHFALVEVTGLEPGSSQPYTVEIDGSQVWPPPTSPLPPSRIATLRSDQELTLAFGSCRMSVPHDAAATQSHGVDALRAYARSMVSTDPASWPGHRAVPG